MLAQVVAVSAAAVDSAPTNSEHELAPSATDNVSNSWRFRVYFSRLGFSLAAVQVDEKPSILTEATPTKTLAAYFLSTQTVRYNK